MPCPADFGLHSGRRERRNSDLEARAGLDQQCMPATPYSHRAHRICSRRIGSTWSDAVSSLFPVEAQGNYGWIIGIDDASWRSIIN